MNTSLWLEASRPRTLPAAISPVLLGTAIAWSMDVFHLGAALAARAGATLIQIGTNYANDYFDFIKGADTEARLGPRRATQAGLVAPEVMRAAFLVAFAAAALVGTYLVLRAGWPLLLVGSLSIALGILYTGGPYPLGYLGLGDVLVLVFFGPVAVAGTVYVQGGVLSADAIVAGLTPGLLSTAILAVNNLRDVTTDAAAGKRTLAVRFGKGFARAEYAVAVLAALAIPLCLGLRYSRPWLFLPTLALPLAVANIREIARLDGGALNPMLGKTSALLVLSSVLLALGWIL